MDLSVCKTAIWLTGSQGHTLDAFDIYQKLLKGLITPKHSYRHTIPYMWSIFLDNIAQGDKCNECRGDQNWNKIAEQFAKDSICYNSIYSTQLWEPWIGSKPPRIPSLCTYPPLKYIIYMFIISLTYFFLLDFSGKRRVAPQPSETEPKTWYTLIIPH